MNDFTDLTDATAQALGIGMHRGVRPAYYHSDPLPRPSLSPSCAHTLVSKSAAHARLEHPRFGNQQREQTDDMATGTLLHRLILGRGGDIVGVFPKTKDGEPSYSWSTAEAKAERKRILAEGNIPVLGHKLKAAELAAQVIVANMAEQDIELEPEDSEVVAVWEEQAENGERVLCRTMFDNTVGMCFWDLKCAEDVHPATCERKIGPMGYAIAVAARISALTHLRPDLAGRIVGRLVWVETEPPHCVVPVELDGAFLEYGQRQWRKAVNRWAVCLKTGEWPGYVPSTYRATPPAYLLMQEANEGERSMGALAPEEF